MRAHTHTFEVKVAYYTGTNQERKTTLDVRFARRQELAKSVSVVSMDLVYENRERHFLNLRKKLLSVACGQQWPFARSDWSMLARARCCFFGNGARRLDAPCSVGFSRLLWEDVGRWFTCDETSSGIFLTFPIDSSCQKY